MFYQNVVYHLYNHTNNKEALFREATDYERFKEKIYDHLLPHADVLCYCLMPTHFHFQVLPKPSGLHLIKEGQDQQVIHGALRILLSSYVRYFNNKYNRRGSLLRAKTKAKPAYTDFIPEAEELEENVPFTQHIPYVKVCFRYIHNNPNSAGLVDSPEEWYYSSAPDYAGVRNENICNYALTERLLGITRLG